MSALSVSDYTLQIPLDLGSAPEAPQIQIGAASADLAFSAKDEAAANAEPLYRRLLYLAVAVSVGVHMMLLALFLGGFNGATRQFGAEEGTPDDLNVSVITEADFRSFNLSRLRQEAPPPAPANEPAPSPPTPQTQALPDLNPPKPDKPNVAQAEKPLDQEGLIAKAYEDFASMVTSAIDRQASQRKQAQRSAQQSANLKSYRPAATRSGKSSQFERDVIWALDATKPQGNGKWGVTVVSFTVASGGQVQNLQLLRSSGDNWLDMAAMMSVRQARLPSPPADLTQADRSFQIHYISR